MSPFVQDDEGREVAIKMDRLDSKKFSPETATKSYIEVGLLAAYVCDDVPAVLAHLIMCSAPEGMGLQLLMC